MSSTDSKKQTAGGHRSHQHREYEWEQGNHTNHESTQGVMSAAAWANAWHVGKQRHEREVQRRRRMDHVESEQSVAGTAGCKPAVLPSDA